MSPAPRVLILNERDMAHPKAGGAEVHVEETFGRLVRRGYEVTVLSSRFRGCAPEDRQAGMHVRRVAGLPHYYPVAAWTCARETRRGRFDVVVECLNKLPFYAPLYAGRPVVALCHHLFGTTAFEQVAWPIAAAVFAAEQGIPALYRRVPFVAISRSTRDDLVQRGVPAERVRVVHCGTSPSALAPPPWRERAQRVVFVGRIEPYKRVDVMLAAVARLADRFPAAEAVVVGRGADLPRLRRIADELGIADRTRFTGHVSDAERDALIADARVSVCPSRKEGWGLTVIEANALGTPVVATDAPGLRDSVEDGKTGFLVPDVEGGRADVDAFADRIGALLGDDGPGATMSEAALAWSRRFDWDASADVMAEVLEAARSGAAA